jgi:multiple sugar transport system permease protein
MRKWLGPHRFGFRRAGAESEAFALRLVLPALAIEFLFVFVPLAMGLYYSLHSVRFFQVGRFVGLDNYWAVLTSPAVLNSFAVTAVFSFASLFFTFVVGFALALHLERDGRMAVFMRAVVLVPYVISMLVGSLLLKWLLSQDSGVPQTVLGPLGLPEYSVFANTGSAMAALIYNAVWRDAAFAMILLLAGLKSIPLELYAAARVDGASAWYRFRRLTLPLLKIPMLVTLVRLLMHFVNSLTFQLILTGGGPADTTETISLRTFRLGFEDYVLGRANALSFVVFLINIAMIMLLIRLFKPSEKLQ